MNALGISSVSFEYSRVVKILIRGRKAARSHMAAAGSRVRLAYAPGPVTPAHLHDAFRPPAAVKQTAAPTRDIELGEPERVSETPVGTSEGVLGVLQRAGQDRCMRCAEPIEPGLLALAAIMCATCRARPKR
jgi:hypothetical protein